MSSRSFRRRNNRRRHRGGQGAEAQGQATGQQAQQGSQAPAEQPGPPGPVGRQQGPGGKQQGPSGKQQGPSGKQQGPGGRQQERRDRQGQQGSGGQRRGGQRREARPGGGQQRGQERSQERERPARPETPITYPDCPVCGKPVRELASALTHRLSKQPAHFECVMKELRDSNEVAAQERICYLGGGCFGVLEFHPGGGANRFVIKKRIQYEEKETPQDWKKTLQVPC
jgi:hypothetical protein